MAVLYRPLRGRLTWNKMNRLFCTVYLMFVSVLLFGQTEIKPIKFTFSLSVGVNLVSAGNSGKFIADDLLYYNESPASAGYYSGAYYKNNWGVELSIGFGGNYTANLFEKNLAKLYPDYYLKPTDEFMLDPAYYKVAVGPAYKIERGRLFFIGRFQTGVINSRTSSADVVLKRKGTNEKIYLSVRTDKPSHTSLLVSPSATVGYRIFKVFALSLDAGYSLHKDNTTYTATSTVYTATSEETIERHTYDNFVHELTLAARLMFTIQRKNPY